VSAKPLTVGELIERLNQYDSRAIVVFGTGGLPIVGTVATGSCVRLATEACVRPSERHKLRQIEIHQNEHPRMPPVDLKQRDEDATFEGHGG
jgi:hypothetical protein